MVTIPQQQLARMRQQIRGQSGQLEGLKARQQQHIAQRMAAERRVKQITEQMEQLKPKTFGQKFRAGLPKMLIGAGLATGIWGTKKLMGHIRHKHESERNFTRMMGATPFLRNEPPEVVKSRFATLQKMAPTLARDPLVAGSIVRQWVEYPTVSAAALRDVVSVERDVRAEPGLLPALNRIAGTLAGMGD